MTRKRISSGSTWATKMTEAKPRTLMTMKPAKETTPPMDQLAWIDAFVGAVRLLDGAAAPWRLVTLGQELWPRFGHEDPKGIARTAHLLWPNDK